MTSWAYFAQEEAQPREEADFQLETVERGEYARQLFGEPYADREDVASDSDEDEPWGGRSAKETLDDPWRMDKPEQPKSAPQKAHRPRPMFLASALYRWLTNRKLEDANGMNEPK